MKAYQIGEQTGSAGLTLVDRPDLVCGPDEAALRVSAVCLNHRDLKVLSGEYGAKRPAERTPGSDGVGEVIAVGANVSSIKVGERATCGHFVTWLDGAFSPSAFAVDVGTSVDGWLAEQVKVPATALLKAPDSLTDKQVAPLPSAGLTAWNALVEVGKIKAGDLVLLLGTGGVSIFALQIAKMHGAVVAITSSSDDKLARARTLGADITINYAKRPDWSVALTELTGGRGADIVVETGGTETLGQSIVAAGPNARIVIIGALSGGFAVNLPNFASVIGKNLTLRGIAAGNRKMLSDFIKAAEASSLHPEISRIFPFAEARAAYDYLAGGGGMGKVMIDVSGANQG